MDTDGWIDMNVVLTFKRIKHLQAHLELLRDTISLSPLIDVDFERYKFRTKLDWQRWIMPGAALALPPKAAAAAPSEGSGGQASAVGSKEHSASEDGEEQEGTVVTGTTGMTSPALSSTSRNDEVPPTSNGALSLLALALSHMLIEFSAQARSSPSMPL